MKAIARRWAVLFVITSISLLLVTVLIQAQHTPIIATDLDNGLSCSVGETPLTLLADDMESGTGNWTVGGFTTTWRLSSFRVHDGTFSFQASNLSTVSDQWLQLTDVALPPAGMGPLQFHFWNYQSMESGPNGCFDGGAVEYSVDAGINWQTFTTTQLLTDPYDGIIDLNFGNPMAGESAWCGDPQDWLESIVDLTPLAGETVTLRFRLATDESNGREGWSVDTVSLNACLPASGYGARLGPGQSRRDVATSETITHSFQLENLGASDSYNVDINGALWTTDLTSPGTIAVGAGLTATITVRVTAPEVVSADSFTLTVVSANDPGNITMEANGITSINNSQYLPAIIRAGNGP